MWRQVKGSVLPLINENKMLLISPTVSSKNIVSDNDFMISLSSANQDAQESIVEYFIKKDGIKKLSVI